MKEEDKKDMKILICGSQRFEEEDFVVKTLDIFYEKTNGAIRKIYTSKFSGACEFARNWAEKINQELPGEKKIEIVEYFFDMVLEKKNQSFYEDAELPAFAIANDPFFIKGKELLLNSGVNVVFCFPNSEGRLGAATENIKRFASLASIPQFDCSTMYQMVQSYRKEVEEETIENSSSAQNQPLGFNNKHPVKAKRRI